MNTVLFKTKKNNLIFSINNIEYKCSFFYFIFRRSICVIKNTKTNTEIARIKLPRNHFFKRGKVFEIEMNNAIYFIKKKKNIWHYTIGSKSFQLQILKESNLSIIFNTKVVGAITYTDDNFLTSSIKLNIDEEIDLLIFSLSVPTLCCNSFLNSDSFMTRMP